MRRLSGAALLLLFLACGYEDPEVKLDEYRRKLDKHVGHASDAEFVHSWGPPDKRDAIAGSEFWTYYFDHGTRTTAFAQQLGSGAVANGSSVNQYDKVVLEFQGGVFKGWRAKVQR
jgi:hypothetical protein